MPSYHLLIDFETWDDKPWKAAPIDMSALVFDWDRFTSDKPYSCLELFKMVKHYKLSLDDLMKNYKGKFTVSEETSKFWLRQDKEVRDRIKPRPNDLTLEEFCSNFLEDLEAYPKITYWWSRGNAFDPVILERLFDSESMLFQLKQLLPHHKVSDVRTWIRSFGGENQPTDFVPITDEGFFKKIMKQHDSRYDVMADVMRLQTLARVNNDMEMVEK